MRDTGSSSGFLQQGDGPDSMRKSGVTRERIHGVQDDGVWPGPYPRRVVGCAAPAVGRSSGTEQPRRGTTFGSRITPRNMDLANGQHGAQRSPHIPRFSPKLLRHLGRCACVAVAQHRGNLARKPRQLRVFPRRVRFAPSLSAAW